MAWIGAISNPVQCWACGQIGHIGRNCPSKGLGKGGPSLGKGTPQVGDKGKGKGAPPPMSKGVPGKGAPGSKGGFQSMK
eukprot:3465768-Karenia_brevis.AAC.1